MKRFSRLGFGVLLGLFYLYLPQALANSNMRIKTIVHVTIPSTDGFPLKGTMYTPGEPGPGALLIHQFGTGQREDYQSLATQLAMQGFHVLTVDLRGHGASRTADSLKTNDGTKIPHDIEMAYQYLTTQPKVNTNRIAISGSSGTVAEAIALASRHQNIKAIVGLSGHADDNGLKFIEETDHLAILGVGADDDQVMIRVDGQWTRLTSAASMHRIIERSIHPDSTLIVYPKAGHGTFMFNTRKELEPQITAWLVQVLASSKDTDDE